jgi:N-acetylmuramoyl-L-alanine amidase
MKIVNHILQGTAAEKISIQETTKTSGKFRTGLPDTIIMHFTAGRDAKSSIRTLADPSVKASAHLVIGRDNSITQMVPFDTISWHAGKSSWEDRIGLNKYSIGIEIDNAGRLDKQGEEYLSWFKKSYKPEEVFEGTHRNEDSSTYWHRYTEKQVEIVESITKMLVDSYGIKTILGHEEISPGRKTDPGPAFPLDNMRNNILYADRQQDEPSEFEVPATTTKDERIGLITANKLNVRDSPTAGSNKVSEPLTKGSLVNIVGQQGNWYKVKIETEGWVSSDWVKTS